MGRLTQTCVSNVPAFWICNERLENWGDHLHTQEGTKERNAITTGTSLSLASLEKYVPTALKKDSTK